MSVKTKALREKLLHVTRSRPVVVPFEAALSDTLAQMRQRQAHCAVVAREGRLAGIFTERDYLMKALGTSKPSDPVSRYMSADPVIGRLDMTVGEAIELMNEKGLRNLPLVDEQGRPSSLLTVSAIIQYLADHFPAEVVNRPPEPILSEEADGA